MRASWIAWIVPALLTASVIYSIYLGFRVAALERELARTGRSQPRSGAQLEREAEHPDKAGDDRLSSRLGSIEDDLADLQESYARLDDQLAGGKGLGGGPADEARILDVVTKAQARVRERQLEFHSAQWRRTRAQIAEDFGVKNNLERWQVDHVKRILEEETEAAADILSRPESAENPELMANEWQRRLDETDEEALRILEGPAVQAWIEARLFERQVLWPWLPSLQPQAKKVN
jgi:hypothetical protein